jgi:diguanylate cyclase (GGDEF)-like protein
VQQQQDDQRFGARLAPFAALTLVALLLSVPRRGGWAEYGAAWLTFALVGATALRTRGTDATVLRLARAVLYLAGVALLREATGGAKGGVGIIALIPVVWVALYGTPPMLRVVLGGVAVTWIVPLLAIGDPRYPASGWRGAVLLVSLAAMIGTAVQRLVQATRRHANERETLLEQVDRLARTDPLTGTANRRVWEEVFAASLDGAPLSIAVLDLDAFKQLNDGGGHEAGDRCLRESAAAWSAQLRAGDLLARIGGDEFAILLPGCGLAVAERIAARVRAATVGTTCSIGVAEWDGAESAPALQRRADEALYEAKRARIALRA